VDRVRTECTSNKPFVGLELSLVSSRTDLIWAPAESATSLLYSPGHRDSIRLVVNSHIPLTYLISIGF
jgi:hypothetical protein